MEQKHSVPSNAFGARVTPEQKSTPSTTPRVPVPQPTLSPGYKSSHRDLTPSEAPVLDLPSASQIADGVRSALAKHDRQQFMNNGGDAETHDARIVMAALAEKVRAGEMTNEAANAAFTRLYPSLDPRTLAGGQK